MQLFIFLFCLFLNFLKKSVQKQLYQGIAFPNSKSYQEYQKQQECDHRHIGKHQHLFVFNKLAPGSAFFLPHGTKIYNKLIELIRKEYRERGYQEVITPQLFHKDLWKQSGHLDKYAENIYMTHDHQMGLKPMNCPGHCLLYKTLQHSYKELPIRFADFGVLHRNEVHGTLTGLTRVRKFTQDDAHIFCTVEQIQSEIKNCLDFLSKVYGRFGFTWELTLSTRPDKYIGDSQIWDEAERQLRIALSDTAYIVFLQYDFDQLIIFFFIKKLIGIEKLVYNQSIQRTQEMEHFMDPKQMYQLEIIIKNNINVAQFNQISIYQKDLISVIITRMINSQDLS